GSMEDMLATMAMTCCVYAGESDPACAQARTACERIPNARFFSLPGLTHMQAFYDSGKVVPPVAEFLGMSQSLLKRATGRCWFTRLSSKDIGFKHCLICMLDVVGIESGS